MVLRSTSIANHDKIENISVLKELLIMQENGYTQNKVSKVIIQMMDNLDKEMARRGKLKSLSPQPKTQAKASSQQQQTGSQGK